MNNSSYIANLGIKYITGIVTYKLYDHSYSLFLPFYFCCGYLNECLHFLFGFRLKRNNIFYFILFSIFIFVCKIFYFLSTQSASGLTIRSSDPLYEWNWVIFNLNLECKYILIIFKLLNIFVTIARYSICNIYINLNSVTYVPNKICQIFKRQYSKPITIKKFLDNDHFTK